MTNSVAKTRVVKLASRLYGRNALVEERPKALDAAGRAAAVERGKVRRARIAELDPICKGEFAARLALLGAVQFVCDVDADDPSLPQLKDALAAYRKIEAAIAERHDLNEEGRKVDAWSRRCNVLKCETSGPLPFALHVCDGDTWEEALTALQAIADRRGVAV